MLPPAPKIKIVIEVNTDYKFPRLRKSRSKATADAASYVSSKKSLWDKKQKPPAAEPDFTGESKPAVCNLQAGANSFYFGVVFENVVTHFAAPTRLFVSAKGQGGVENVVAVNPHRAGLEL